MKLLITGSNGFVGSYFINQYKEKYEIKTFSFLKDDINSLDCSDLDVVFHNSYTSFDIKFIIFSLLNFSIKEILFISLKFNTFLNFS
jgi:nucleoside-diphosphate-sugar epimerase